MGRRRAASTEVHALVKRRGHKPPAVELLKIGARDNGPAVTSNSTCERANARIFRLDARPVSFWQSRPSGHTSLRQNGEKSATREVWIPSSDNFRFKRPCTVQEWAFRPPATPAKLVPRNRAMRALRAGTGLD